VGLERGPHSLVRITEELLEWKSSGSGLENREYGRGDPLRWPRDTLYPQKLALTAATCGGCSVGIVRLRTKTTEFVVVRLRSSRRWLMKRNVMWDVAPCSLVEVHWPFAGAYGLCFQGRQATSTVVCGSSSWEIFPESLKLVQKNRQLSQNWTS
jgi:hypothetical protein